VNPTMKLEMLLARQTFTANIAEHLQTVLSAVNARSMPLQLLSVGKLQIAIVAPVHQLSGVRLGMYALAMRRQISRVDETLRADVARERLEAGVNVLVLGEPCEDVESLIADFAIVLKERTISIIILRYLLIRGLHNCVVAQLIA
jgi:hypothetical protein